MELPIIGRPVTCEQFLNSEPSEWPERSPEQLALAPPKAIPSCSANRAENTEKKT